jgi:1-deoxy-D-xylulose-5-phosphate reductoisomerase
MKVLSILGSTGSIGRSTLDIVVRHPDLFRVEVLTGGANAPLLIEQIRQFRPAVAAVADPVAAEIVAAGTRGTGCAILSGDEGVLAAAARPGIDLAVAAIAGGAGLLPTLAAVRSGAALALANKEALVMAGELVTAEAKRRNLPIIPVDSEHSALFQCLAGQEREDVAEIVLTASGGPFWSKPKEAFASFTAAEALNHPRWSMGPKVTIDSATMMNKGLEVIEARWLFDIGYDRISVLVHPQSIVHSLVRYADGSFLAQLGEADMRIPISLALFHPRRWHSPLPPLDLAATGALTFQPPDHNRFPLLAAAYRAGKVGGTAPAVLSAANEEAVGAFLSGEIPFPAIADVACGVLDAHVAGPILSEADVLAAATWAVDRAREAIAATRR